MLFETWLLFAVTETFLCLTPGPAVLLALSQALARGTVYSVWSSLGILTANAFYFALSATGFGALLLASYEVFFLVKWIGAAYLVYLGVMTFLSRDSGLTVHAAGAARSGRRAFADGVVLQASNPKAILFFAALLPQFVDPSRAVGYQVAILGITSVVVEFFVLLGYGILAGRAVKLAAKPGFAKTTNRIAGTLLVGAGAGLAAIPRS